MAKTSGELEKEFIETAKEKTGKSLQEWLALVGGSRIEKRNDILDWLKKGHGLNHMQAQFITGMHLNHGAPVYINEDALLDNHFVKSPGMRHLFEYMSDKIITSFQGTQLIPKKTYLSFTAIREFAAVNVKPRELRLGMDLGDHPFSETLFKSKLTGPMPRITHMIILSDEKHFGKNVMEQLKNSYDRSHPKK